MLGLIGKHPGYGDFLRHGVDPSLADWLDGWLNNALMPLRDEMGEGAWPAFWDAAPVLRFWIGRTVTGGHGLAGILSPSRDKVGRRFPLLLMAQNSALAPPLLNADQAPYEALEAHLEAAAPQPGQGAAALLDGLDPDQAGFVPEPAAMAGQTPLIWAHNAQGDLAGLLSAMQPVDHTRAMLARSYWWAPARSDRAAICLAQQGLPDSAALGWLLSGGPAAEARDIPALQTPQTDIENPLSSTPSTSPDGPDA